MRIYNPFKKESYTKSFSYFWIEKFYERIIPEFDYDIYVNDEEDVVEVVYVIKSDSLRKRLFNIIQKLKEIGTISLEFYDISIRKTVINKKEQEIFAFYMNINKKEPKDSLDSLEKLVEFTTFVNKMNELEFRLLEGSFKVNDYHNFFEAIFWFTEYNRENTENEKKENDDLLINVIHWNMQRRFLKSFYDEIKEKTAFKLRYANYSMDMLKMFFNYYSNGVFPDNILELLKAEMIKNSEECFEYYDEYNMKLVHSFESFKNHHEKIEETEEYTIYSSSNGNEFKIYNRREETLDRKLKKLYDLCDIKKLAGFKVEALLVDINNEFIGYEYFEVVNFEEMLPLKDFRVHNIKELVKCLWKVKVLVKTLSSRYKTTDNNYFNIEEDISFIFDNGFNFYFSSDDSVIRALNFSEEDFEKELAALALKFYLSFINEKYGSKTAISKEEFFELLEVKILPPQFAKELCKYMLNEKVDTKIVYNSFFVDFPNNYLEGKGKYLYYGKFIYDPLELEYIFVDKVYEKFGENVELGTEKHLSDERILCFFKGRRELKNFNKDLEKNKEKFRQVFSGDCSDEIHLIGLNKIIYSRDISNDGTYYMIGYVSDPVVGTLLSEMDFSKLNNKEFIKIAMTLFIKFNYKYINLTNVRMDSNYNFYVNLFEKVSVSKCNYGSFAEGILSIVRINGLDDAIVKDIDFCNKAKLESLYNSMDSFCDVHGVYFSSSEKMCSICQRTLYDVEEYNGDFGEAIFEDEYAIHYILTSSLNIKVYKEDIIDMERQDQSIDKYLVNQPNLGQDLFLPYKKAIILSSRKFIGYVYNRVNFSECKDLSKDFTNLKRLKALITLCTQIQDLRELNLFFSKNPYVSILFSPEYKKRIQLVNIDLLDFNNEGEKRDEICSINENYILDYVLGSISDEVGLDEINANSLEELILEMKELAKNMTKVCTIHGIYYHKKYMLCPKCLPNLDLSLLEKHSIFLSVDDWLKNRKLENEGGESYIYEYENGVFAKIFKEDEVSIEMKFAIIMKIFERKHVLEKFNKNNSKFVYIIPQKVIIDSETNTIRGYLLQEVKDAVSISTLRDKIEVEKLGLDMKDTLEILITTGEGIEYLHKKANMYIGDLNGRNILFDKDKTVYFLDFDGMGIDDISPQFFTEGYVDPVAQKNQTISMKDDWYSFAVQAFYYLTFTHPFNGIYYDEDEKRNLEIDEKMERRISLLGNHGMKAPSLARTWSWMEGTLKNTFLNIFEGDVRVNITFYLKEYYKDFFSSKYVGCPELKEENSFSAPKTVTREISIFGSDLKKVINNISYIAVDENGNDSLVILLGKKGGIHYSYDKDTEVVTDVLVSDDKEFAYIVFENSLVVLHVNSNTEIFREDLLINSKVVVSKNTLYYTSVTEGKNVIFKLEFSSNGLAKQTVIRFNEEMYTKSFYVLNNEKFVIVKEDKKEDYIFCNDIKYLALPKTSSSVKYKVLYDSIRNEWLVINTEGLYVVIKSDGKYIKSTDSEIVGCNIRRVQFENGNIYIPKDGKIYIINTKKNKSKNIKCYSVTKNSYITVRKNGFYIFNNDKCYEYVKLK